MAVGAGHWIVVWTIGQWQLEQDIGGIMSIIRRKISKFINFSYTVSIKYVLSLMVNQCIIS